MLASFAWGFAAAATLIVGGAFALRFPVGERALGMVMAFGSGVLISAVAFELVAGGVRQGRRRRERRSRPLSRGPWSSTRATRSSIESGGGDRKHSGGRQAEGSALAIVLGIVLDGIPESIVLGLTIVVSGSVSAAFLVAVACPTSPRRSPPAPAWRKPAGRSAASSASGCWLQWCRDSPRSSGSSPSIRRRPGRVAFVLSFAGGAILTMLADTMMPEAFEHGGKLVGLVTTLGFGLAFAISALD